MSKWIVKPRDFELDLVKYQVKLTHVNKEEDPLLSGKEIKLPTKKKVIKKGNIKMQVADFNPLEIQPVISKPKTAIIEKKEEGKPVVQQIQTPELKNHSVIINKNYIINDPIESHWSTARKSLMDLFCNNFNMEVKSVYTFSLDEEDLQKNYKIESGRCRLEELESDKKNNFNIISSGEYVAKMEILKREMLQKWEVEDKVGALKIIIHCTKMLNDVFTPKFYTHKFLIITDILDTFAKLVFLRIHKLSFPGKTFKENEYDEINITNINSTAKDICSNWVLKCSCIRELLPRIYIDTIFLKIFKFIFTEKEIEQKLIMIAKMIRGISHPLISYYVSMYLAKVGSSLFPKYKSYLLILIENLSKFNLNEDFIKKLNYDNFTNDELKKIVEPCTEWIIYCYSKNITVNQYNSLMKIYDESKNFFIMKYIIIHIPIKFIFNQDYLEYIFACSELYDYNECIILYLLICHTIINTNNPIESKYLTLIWEKVKKSKSKSIFIDCCILIGEIFIKFYNEDVQDKFFEEVFDIFKNTINLTSEDNTYYHKFEIFLLSILTKISNYSNILNADNFLYLLENFKPDVKLNICNTILNQIIENNNQITDPYLAFSLMKIGKYIHDSIDIFTADSKKKTISLLIISFIKKVDFGLDYENLLNFYTEARGSYSELDEVIETLIKEVQRICISALKIVNGKHNKKTLRFCKVCIAYCQITIPSIRSLYTQLKLLLTTSEIALLNNLISECDSLIKNLITILSKATEESKKFDLQFFENLIGNLISLLIVVPSNPESPFQLINGLINIFSKSEGNLLKVKLLLNFNLIKYFVIQLQNKLPYHVINVDSNDEIFTKDENFRNECLALLEHSINDILNDISEMDSKLGKFDYDDYEFLMVICLRSADYFNCFETTKYSQSIIGKLNELGKNYLEHLKRNNKSFSSDKISRYNNFINKI